MNNEELQEYAKSSLVFYGLDLSRISSVLIAQIHHFETKRILSVHGIGDQLKRIESGSASRVGQFKHLPLKGLYKSHFFDARFFLGNMNAQYGFDRGGNANLDKVIHRAFEQNTSGYCDDEMAMFLAHEMTVGMFEKRAQKQKLTGEWIIFQEYQGNKYYLCVASHLEDDNDIYERVKLACMINFPFLMESGT
ncbi:MULTISPECIES: hypothetical protein [Vibrio harveyi group]|uniref:hypothetical protein n=1 Tax=Vibrio harveyi group TaxID=717610 RepID=UPI0005F20E68|nr:MULTISPECIES: hypothetical protein [Vibrio harveyi group]MCZ0761695.1 hypothetical protein [Vibrio diabolicus]MDX1258058.1 hypothetical protein [Vibrio parahaemolyticus]TBT14229.1 hypothetical protein D5E83_24890 [Vibrio parahaemolyticus]HCH5604923.1 hypothetical protein [Vibrio parahaemolyticus]